MKWIVAIVLMAELFASAWLAEHMFLYQTTISERLQPALYCILFGGVGGCVYCLRGVYPVSPKSNVAAGLVKC